MINDKQCEELFAVISKNLLELGFYNFFICGIIKQGEDKIRMVYDFIFDKIFAVEMLFHFLNENPEVKSLFMKKLNKEDYLLQDELVKFIKL